MKGLLLALALVVCGHATTSKTVCSSGCDYTTIQAAVDAASYGWIINVAAGETFSGQLQLKKKLGTPRYIVIRSSRAGELPGNVRVTPNDTARMATLQHTSYVVTVEQGASYYRLEGLEIRPTSGTFLYGLVILYEQAATSGPSENERAKLAHHIIIDRCYIHGWDGQEGPRNGIYLNSGYTEVINSWIGEIKDSNSEAKAIIGWSGDGPYIFRNNHLEASSITTLLGGDTPNIAGIRATGSSFVGNYYYHPWTWRRTTGTSNPSGVCMWDARGGEWYRNTSAGTNWECQSGTWTSVPSVGDYYSIKNRWELKNSIWTMFDGNHIQNSYAVPTFGSQHGAAMLFNQVDTSELPAFIGHTTVTNNLIRRTSWGISIGRIGTGYYRNSVVGLRIENNLFDRVMEEPYTANDAVLMQTTGQTERYSFLRNTVISDRGSGNEFGRVVLMTADGSSFSAQQVFIGNIIPFFRWGFVDSEKAQGSSCGSIPVQWQSPWMMSRNLIADPQNARANSYYGQPYPVHQLTNINSIFGELCETRRCVGCSVGGESGGPTDWASVGFVNYAGGNYRLSGSSAWKGWSHEGFDPGADIDVVEWSTANAAGGAHNPYLDFRVRALVPASTTATLRYTAYNTAACAVTVASNPSYTSPEFTNAGSAGNRDRVISITGLSAATRYWYRVVCDSTYRRSGVFWTR